MNFRHRALACVAPFALSLVASTAAAAPQCAHAGKDTPPSLERGDRWARVARDLAAPTFTAAWSPVARRSYGLRYHRWRERRLALISAASLEWIGAAAIDGPSRPVARCFATIAEKGDGVDPTDFFESQTAMATGDVIVHLSGPELDIPIWARIGRAFAHFLAEERRPDEAYEAKMPSEERNKLYRYFGTFGPYNERESDITRHALEACERQSTARQTWTQDSEDCERLRARLFRWSASALDELRAPPAWVAVQWPANPVSLTLREPPPSQPVPPR